MFFQGSAHVHYASVLFKIVSEELKDVLIKDLTRKVEQDTFAMLEEHWDMCMNNKEATVSLF